MSSEEKTPDVEELQKRVETLEECAVLRDELNNQDEDGGEISRRDFGKAGILAALGLGGAAGVGGRQAVKNAVEPAQAAHGGGSIGTESDPVGTIYAHDFGSSTEPIQNLYTTKQSSLDVGTLNADELSSGISNNVYWVDAGDSAVDINATIDDALAASQYGDDVAVALRPGAIHDLDGEIHVKSGVTLYGMGVRLNMQADTNCLFVDTNARVVGPLGIRTQAPNPYTSDAIVFDTSRTGKRYNAVAGSHSTVTGPITLEGHTGEGNAIAFRTDGSPIANGVEVGWFTINGFNNGILADTANGGWVNGYQLHGSIQNATTLVNHTGTESFVGEMRGELQSNSNTDYGIRNQVSGKGSLRFYGQMWDNGGYNVAAFEGERIRMYTNGYARFSHGTVGTGTVVDGYMDARGTTGTPTVQSYHLPGDNVINDDGIYFLGPDMTFYGPV